MDKYFTNATKLYNALFSADQPARVLCVKEDGEILVDTKYPNRLTPRQIVNLYSAPILLTDVRYCTPDWNGRQSWTEMVQQELTIALMAARALYVAKQKTELGLILKDYFNRVDRICTPLKSLI